MFQESMLTAVTVTGLSVYGLALLFAKAWLILLLANSLADQFEFSPATIRHSIWMIALVSLGLMPLLKAALPALPLMTLEVTASIKSVNATALNTQSHYGPASLSWLDWLSIVYLLVVVIRFGGLLKNVIELLWITANAGIAPAYWYRLARQHCDYKVLIKIAPSLQGPVTFGHFRPVILLPVGCDRWSDADKSMIIQHELAHIQRRDWLVQLLAQCIAILYWPVIGISAAIRQLSLEAERASDDYVLSSGVDAADYAGLLLRQARINVLAATVALGRSSELAHRVRHIINVYVDRAGIQRTRYLLIVMATLLLVPYAAVQASISYQNYTPLAGLSIVPLTRPDNVIPAMGNWLDQLDGGNIQRPSKPVLTFEPLKAMSLDRTGGNSDGELAGSMVPPVRTRNELEIVATRFTGAQLLETRRPYYPTRAQQQGIEGRVVVQFDVDTQGRVVSPRIVESPSGKLFNRSVLGAIQHYRYEPYLINGEPVQLHDLREEFQFRLLDSEPSKTESTGNFGIGPPIDSG